MTTSPRLLTSCLSLAVCLLVGLAVATPAHADKLILFKNGKALRVKSAQPNGKWLKCEVVEGNFMSVPADGVLSIEDSVVTAREGDFRPNQVAAGTGGGYVPPRGPMVGAEGGLPPQVAPTPDEGSAQTPEEIQAAIAEEQEARKLNQPDFGAAGRRMRGGPAPNSAQIQAGAQQNQPGVIPGLTPLNQAGMPFQSRRGGLQQRGLRNAPRGAATADQQPDN